MPQVFHSKGESLMTVAKKNFIIMKIAASGRDVNQNQVSVLQTYLDSPN